MRLYVHAIFTNARITIRPFSERCCSCLNQFVHQSACPNNTLVRDDMSLPLLLSESLPLLSSESLLSLVLTVEEVYSLHSSWPSLMVHSFSFHVPKAIEGFATSKFCSCNQRQGLLEVALTQSTNCT